MVLLFLSLFQFVHSDKGDLLGALLWACVASFCLYLGPLVIMLLVAPEKDVKIPGYFFFPFFER